MRKVDFMAKREFSFGKLNSAQLPAPTIRPVESGPMPGMASPRWENNQCAVRVAVAPTLSTEGSQPNMHASNPDPRGARSWSQYLRDCLTFLGCK
jgi:hypothetical protein